MRVEFLICGKPIDKVAAKSDFVPFTFAAYKLCSFFGGIATNQYENSGNDKKKISWR